MGTVEQLNAEKEKVQKELRQLENRQKALLNKQRDAERRAITRRLIERDGELHSPNPLYAPQSQTPALRLFGSTEPKSPHGKEVRVIAICHIPIKIIQRSKGKSAVAAAAYRSGTKLTNEWDGLTHDYTHKGSVIPADGLLEVVSVSSDESGGYSASFASDLPFGSYYVKERTTNGAYILSILVNEGEAVSNELLRGRVDGVKVGENTEGGEDVTLAGALMGLFRPDTEEFTEENTLLTAVTGKDGSFSFENTPYGHWIVKEISAPDLYTVSPQQHHVYIGADGQHIEIRVENTLIRGSVQVTKTEAVEEPSPVEKEDKKDKNSFLRFLPGTVFDLYADSNANQEYDPDDQKIGTLKETDAGYHTAENLLAGGYFIKESKAPEGFSLTQTLTIFPSQKMDRSQLWKMEKPGTDLPMRLTVAT